MDNQEGCQECGESIRGRADKKFCSDMCRNAYNNKLNSDANNYMRNVNNALRKNRRILKRLCPNDKIKLKRSKLVEKSFDFNYITSRYVTKTGNVYNFCYEYGYLELENGFVAIVVREEYLAI